MAAFKPDWLPFAMGGMPYTSAAAAWDVILEYFAAIPTWPQLPRRALLENMYAQFSERFPAIELQNGRIYVDTDQDLNPYLEALYLAYLENDLTYGAISPSYANGLATLRQGHRTLSHGVIALKGQVTGPVSWGLTVVDRALRPILYDEVLADAVSKHLHMKAAWQESELQRFAPTSIIFVDEPYMASLGSSFISVGREQVIGLLEEVFAGLRGLSGIHCCGSTDWSLVLSTSVDIISLDAYDYAHTLLPYAEDLNRFLARGGIVAWGIVPAGIASETETIEGLVQRLEEVLARLVAEGVSHEALLSAGMITPSCSVGSLTPSLVEHVFALTAGVSEEMRWRYVVSSAEAAP